MRTWTKVLGLAVVLAVGGAGRADDDKKRTADKPGDGKATRTDDRHDDKRADDKKFTDTHFVDHAYTGGQNEVLLNRMALDRSRNEDVRRFAQKMLEDHTKSNQDFLLIVSEQRIAVPDKPLPEQEKDLQHITSNDVRNFDKEFMDHMVTDHEKMVKLFEQGSKELKNDRLKEFATKTLPTLREHLKMAKETRDKVAKAERGEK